MPKRTPHEVVEASFKEAGYQLKSRYERCQDKLSFICPNGHEHQITWMDWKQGSRCGKCKRISPKRLSHELVEASFKDAGYQLLSQYERCQDKLSFVCPKGHQHKMSWMDWKRGYRCGKCAGWYRTHEEVKEIFSSEGYTLLSKYEKSDTRLEYICPKGHSSSIIWESWKAGNRCDFCARNIRSFDYVKESFSKEGYTLLTEQYKGCHQKLEFLCPKNHSHTTTWCNWDRGARCRTCAGQVITEEQVRKSFEVEGYSLLSKYTQSKRLLTFFCPNGHTHTTTWSRWAAGYRCGKCIGKYPDKKQVEIKTIKRRVAGGVSQTLIKQKIKKSFSSTSFADRIAAQIYEHLGDRPENHHLDHIIPQSFFDHRNQHEIEACWDIDNLQWLPAIANIKKSNKLKKEDIAKFTEKQLDILRIASRKPRSLEKYIPRKKMYAEQLKLFA